MDGRDCCFVTSSWVAHLPVWIRWSLLSLLGAGCTRYPADAQRREEQSEFVRLDSAVRALQAAENAEKSASLVALRATSCQRLCEFRTTCLSAFERHVEAVQGVQRLETELQAPHANAARVGQHLLLAQRELSTAQPLIQECGRLQGALRRKLER